ncbi:RdgB/HAM1 family non-canonical purine NTP pyrophosphatase [Arenicella xantha]|uniref:dITP/XTP pyrophosphatase n=1 Tax=Arenicella xantha TaxID=644221 RepID=A0A395JH91_9GAMM|nr:RdgB/HAM1 family non-canonical purine NTP pyrophosphatase [Arenicella xantha]RBP48909.1 XTP/dITP diphosphohydrolase [Arenicella xantha]
MTKVVLATGNQGKVLEMQEVLREFGFSVLPQSEFDIPEAVEDGLSFIENAIIKARHACRLTGLPAIADDSGLEVDALNGAPGIYSSRYADGQGSDANNTKLLHELTGVTNRAARFQCVIVYLQHALDPTPIICQGTWEGEIANSAAGDHGFGYDPLFYIPELGCHAAQLAADQKKTLSHRGQALAQLKLSLTSENSLFL